MEAAVAMSDSAGEGSESEIDPDAPRMRVGEEYQAEIPDVLNVGGRAHDDSENVEREVLQHVKHWDPATEIPEEQLEKYIKVATRRYGYSMEQAMGLLYYHKNNIADAMQDLRHFTPFRREWTAEEQVLFQQAFKSHGKSFRRIRSMLTQKSIPELVQYYYEWKKVRSKSKVTEDDVMHQNGANGGDEDGVGRLSDTDTEFEAGKGNRRLGKRKQSTYSFPDDVPSKKRLRLPKGMHLDVDALSELLRAEDRAAADDVDENAVQMQKMSNEIVRQRQRIQANKQALRELEQQQQNVEDFRGRQDMVSQRPSTRWMPAEVEMAAESVRHYGKDYDAMAAIVGTKSVNHCRNLVLNNQKALNGAYEEYRNTQAALGKTEEAEELSEDHPYQSTSPALATHASAVSDVDVFVDTTSVKQEER